MNRHPLEQNSFFSLLRIVYGFFEAIIHSLWLIVTIPFTKEERKLLRKSHFLESLHYFVHDWPKTFWKFPTGIGIGRSIGSFLSFFFKKNSSFESSEIHKNTKKPKAFTLIEMIMSITLFAILMVMAFTALGNIGVARNLVEWRIDINEQLYTASEKLATTIKEGGTIDYEEYFNRTMVGLTLSGGHYRDPTGYGNYWNGGSIGTSQFGSGSYFCRSGVGVNMGANWCFSVGTFNSAQAVEIGSPQRYGEYKTQFFDYNSDENNDINVCTAKGKTWDLGDANCDGNITGDDDDEDLGVGPEAFSGSSGLAELYLIKKTDRGLERLMLRRRVELDPNAPAGYGCNTQNGSGSGCIGRLEMLRLVWKDAGFAHEWITASNTGGLFDGKIDTWECHPDFNCAPITIGSITRNLPTGKDSEWVSLFDADVDVRNIKFFPVPAKDYHFSWKEVSPGYSIAGYVRFTTTLGFGWERRRKLKIQNPEVTIATTVTLDN